jgi:hypothetical protein
MTSSKDNYYNMYSEVFVISENTELARSVCEILRQNKCRVFVFLPEDASSRISQRLNSGKIPHRCYFLFLLNYIPERSIRKISKSIDLVISLIEKIDAKTIFTFPYTYSEAKEDVYDFLRRSILENGTIYKGLIYLGDVLSRSFVGKPESYLDRILADMGREGTPSFSVNTSFNPISPEAASEALVSSLFSMSAYGTETAILGKQVAFVDILEVVLGGTIRLPIGSEEKLTLGPRAKMSETRVLDEDISGLFLARGKWISEHKDKTENVKPRIYDKSVFNKEKILGLFKKPKSRDLTHLAESEAAEFLDSTHERLAKKRKSVERMARSLAFFVLLVIVSPLLLLGVTRISILTSNYLLEKGYIQQSKVVLGISGLISVGAKDVSLFFMKVPLVGAIYEETYSNSEMLVKLADLQMGYLSVFENTADFIRHVNSAGNVSSIEMVDNISLELNNIYSKIGFLEGEWLKEGSVGHPFLEDLFPGKDLSEVKNKILLINKILGQSETILGKSKPSNYLVLFEDNSEIRPTGGKIYALGVLTFTDAKISNMQFLNFDEVNQKMIGKVEPPQPLNKYFGKDYWYLGDSNWYLDFPSSAEKVEWFLDKGVNISVDGVISLDSTAVDKLSRDIYRQNSLSEDNPDYDRLKQFLVDLTRQNDKLTSRLIFDWFRLLDEKHILFFVHNNDVRGALNDLGWDGSMKNVDCTSDCYLDAIGFAEFAGSFGSENIKKEAILKISVEEGVIKKKLTIFLENKNSFDYKTYIRVFSNPDSGFSPVKIMSGDNIDQQYPEVYGVNGRKEAGIFLKLERYEVKAIDFAWENSVTDFPNIKRYSILFRKQPGEIEYPVEVDLKSVSKNVERSTPLYSLTSDGVWSYNTNLLNDFETDFFLR